MATIASCATQLPSRPAYSCIRCAQRKVKCDRQTPCNACVRHSVECVYNPSHPPRNRNRRLKTQVLADQVKQYEALLREKGIDPDLVQHAPDSELRHNSSNIVNVIPNETSSDDRPAIEVDATRSVNRAQVVQIPGRLKFVDNILWTRIVEELHDPHNVLEETSNNANDPDAYDDYSGFVIDDQPRHNNKGVHPPPQRILQLWQIFAENIDPLTKVVHVPTLGPAIEKAAKNTGAIPRELEALMFAIYSAAVMSLTDEESLQRLNESRRPLLTRYISATKRSLHRANMLGTTSLVVLQAFIIHLLTIRDIYQPRAIWSLTGVALRIAQGMRLERDGVYLGLSPFETEMRRRVWWQLKMHDFRTAELCGIGKFQDLHTGAKYTNWPTNVNDDQLYPGMTSLASESGKLTDTAFVSWKCELLNYVSHRVADLHRQGKTSSPWDPQKPENDSEETGQSFRKFEELLEAKYLRYCDPSQPLHLVTMLMARSSINVIRFMSHHPRRWGSREQTPPSQRQMVWDICINLLEQHNMLQSNPFLRKFAWYAPYFQQWHAIIHILDTVRADPLKAGADKAWKHIENVYECNPDLISDMRKQIHVAVGGLCLKAYTNRESALRNKNMSLPPIPRFIAQLRQQHEDAKASREERLANGVHLQTNYPFSNDVASNFINGARPRAKAGNTVNNVTRGITSQAGPALGSQEAFVGPQPTEFAFGFNDGQIDHMIDFDFTLDFMLDQDCGDDSATHTISWDQWDSWLANSNMTHPFSTDEEFIADT